MPTRKSKPAPSRRRKAAANANAENNGKRRRRSPEEVERARSELRRGLKRAQEELEQHLAQIRDDERQKLQQDIKRLRDTQREKLERVVAPMAPIRWNDIDALLFDRHSRRFAHNAAPIAVRPAASAASASMPHDDEDPGLSPLDLRTLLGVSKNTLNAYARKAGVRTPGKGERNHRYPLADAVRILEQFKTYFPNSVIKDKAAAAMENPAAALENLRKQSPRKAQ